MMSEIDNSTLVESAMEMQPLEQEPAAVITETSTEIVAAPQVSNQEAMTALTLSRIKKQSKQIENLTKLLSQVPPQFRNLEKKQSKQLKQISLQVKVLQNQVKQVQKQVARIKVKSASVSKRKVARKAKKKSKSRRR
jgi:hypothetical protein